MRFRFVTVPERGVHRMLSDARDRLTIYLILRDDREEALGASAGLARPRIYPPRALMPPRRGHVTG
jgi:hypothetical protein